MILFSDGEISAGKWEVYDMKEKKVKTFVLDTNVLLHSALSIESFSDNDVVIPMAVVEELDKFKKVPTNWADILAQSYMR